MTTAERLFRAYCVRRDGLWSGQFYDRDDARAAGKWAVVNLPGRPQFSVRTLRNYIATVGLVYELRVANEAA